MSHPWVIAHRGSSATHPENTGPAFDEAVATGCDALEVDVQLSADGVPVVFHDRTLRRLGAPRVRVRQRELAALQSLDAGSWFDSRFRGEGLLTLDQVLRRYAHRMQLLIEIKAREPERYAADHRELAAQVARALCEYEAGSGRHGSGVPRLPDPPMVLSFEDEVLAEVRRLCRGVKTVRNLRAPRRVGAALRRALAAVDVVSVDRKTLTPGLVRLCQDLGKPVLVFTCNTRSAVRRALACGVDGIMSDRPAWLRECLAAEAVAP